MCQYASSTMQFYCAYALQRYVLTLGLAPSCTDGQFFSDIVM